MPSAPIAAKPTVVKHREVAAALRGEIDSGRWSVGERLPGEQELARNYQVALMTMRHAVANLVDEGVLFRVRGKGTFLVPKKDADAPTEMALLFPSNSSQRDAYYFPEVLQGFQSVLDIRGQTTSVYPLDMPGLTRFLAPGAAVACIMLEETQARQIEHLRDNGFRVLAINRYSGRRSIPSVRIDDFGGIARAVEHLVELGHQRLGFIRGPRANFDAIDRLKGFRESSKRLHVRSAAEAGDGFTEENGYQAAFELLAGPSRPTAIVCASDLSALGAVKAITDAGLHVPNDLSIVGFGNFSVAEYLVPRLTTVRQSRTALGRAAAESLMELAAGNDVVGVTLTAELIVRDSTAAMIPGK